MARLTITPWRHSSDLLAVRQQLYRLDENAQDERRYAVDRIMAWKLRSSNLPHAVESTALLVDAFNHHDTPGNSSFSIRAAYAAAFCRFVTGYCDIGRNKERSLEPSSMLEIARQIDMPPEFVALRHEATHEELPSEQRIIAACKDALHWLWTVYWSRLDALSEHRRTVERSLVRAVDKVEHSRATMRKLFKDHRSATKAQLKANQTPSVTDANHLVEQLANGDSLPVEVHDVVAKDVVEKGLLIPSEKGGLRASNMDGAYLLWDDLLLALDQQVPDFFLAIVDAMLATLSNSTTVWDDAPTEKATSSWLVHFACSDRWTQSSSHNLASHIMRFCVLHHTPYTSRLGQDILSAANNEAQDEWEAILKASELHEERDAAVNDQSLAAVTTHTEDEPEDEDEFVSTRWRKAVLAPSVPIGVCS